MTTFLMILFFICLFIGAPFYCFIYGYGGIDKDEKLYIKILYFISFIMTIYVLFAPIVIPLIICR